MPVGIIINAAAVMTGGLLGSVLGGRLGETFKENLNLVFGACSMFMGISSIVKMENMPAVEHFDSSHPELSIHIESGWITGKRPGGGIRDPLQVRHR